MAFPTYNPEWATEPVYSDGVTPNKVRPDESLRNYGYTPLTSPTAQELNWQLNNIYLQIQELKTLASSAFQTPVGRLIFIDGDNRNPSVIYGYGTWVPFGEGRVLVGSGTGTDINGVAKTFAAGATGGEFEHKISNSELPEHNHTFENNYMLENFNNTSAVPASNKKRVGFINGGLGINRPDNDNDTLVFVNDATDNAGGSQAMNVTQPYISVCIWKRTA